MTFLRQVSVIDRLLGAGDFVGCMLLLALWQAGYMAIKSPVFPGPIDVSLAIAGLLSSYDTLSSVVTTFGRGALGIFISMILALGLGLFSSYVAHGSRWGLRAAPSIVSPVASIIQASPAILWITLLIVWIGQGTKVVVLTTALSTFPILYWSFLSGVSSLGKDITDLVGVYRIDRARYWRSLLLPSVASYMLAGMRYSFGISWKVAATAEYLAAPNGIGSRIYWSYRSLDMIHVFAWASILIAIGMAAERLGVKVISMRVDGGYGRT